jgi:hypothetical protein
VGDGVNWETDLRMALSRPLATGCGVLDEVLV